MYFWYVMFKVDRAHPHLLSGQAFQDTYALGNSRGNVIHVVFPI